MANVGYLLISTPNPSTYLGGVLVTNEVGLPVEFRYTDPVQPGKLQQLLYGKTLSHHIKRQVVTETLLRSLETKGLNWLFVTDESLMGRYALSARQEEKVELLRLSETQAAPIGKAGALQSVAEGESLIQVAPNVPPVRLATVDVPKPVEGETKDLSGWPNGPLLEQLLEAGNTMDLIEPFSRIERLLDNLWQEAQGKAEAASPPVLPVSKA